MWRMCTLGLVERIGQGRENAKLFLETNPDIAADLEAKLKGILFPHLQPAEKKADTEKSSKEQKTAETPPSDDKELF